MHASPGVAFRPSPLQLSVLFHLGGALLVAVLLLLPGWQAAQVPVPFEVLENPVQALSPPRPLQPQSTPRPKPESPSEKKRAVFGASRGSLRASGDENAPEIKAGNTLAKAPDERKLGEDDPDALPIPTEEYLVTRMPEVIAPIRVPYPEAARKAGISGPVVFDVLIDEQGRVREARLISGLGHGLDEAAQSAIIGQLRFKPALVGDKPVAVRIRYAHRFVLER